MNLHNLGINPNWSLFLDRDGIINVQRPNDYVKTIGEFEFIDDAGVALSQLRPLFRRIVIVTNQQGVGKGLMTHSDLEHIHTQMHKEITLAGGYIDAVYSATEKSDTDYERMRKPDIGMALNAQRDFPEIVFETSLMVGDTETDMRFGKNANMYTVLIVGPSTTSEAYAYADFCFQSLTEFVSALVT